ncbi:OmpP1/FadL family transporter [Stutzerimonas tarimensis]|uniref:OmpP1/FadL family transporter n=1 Tax=Stutzerimonas tarimensis TaxID=1507735 RepID=A0ABV7T049_9GAMM
MPRADRHGEYARYPLGGPRLLYDSGALNGRYRASLDFTTPESLESALSWRLDERWTSHGSAVWTRWGRLQEIVVENRGVALPGFTEVRETMNWSDTLSWHLGAAYQASPQWTVRAGFALDPSPTRRRDRTARVPVGDRKLYTIGAGWSPNRDVTLDLAYAYAQESTAQVKQSALVEQTAAGPLPIQPGYFADYRNRFHVLTAQLSYRF